MPIDYADDQASFRERVTVEEAEPLLQWLQQHPGSRVDLSACTHLHPANLQILLAGQANVCAWPDDSELGGWLRSVLSKHVA